MRISHLLLLAGVCLALIQPVKADPSLLESFRISTKNAEVRSLTGTSIQLTSDSNSYWIKLEPNEASKVVFSLSGIGYTSTVRFTNLLFAARITGYRHGDVVMPVISFDDINRDVKLDGNMLVFQNISGALPVWFNQPVDSIQLQFSNSYGANMDQYLGIQDLRVVPNLEVVQNPKLNPCAPSRVMIAMDGSSSIDREERSTIGNALIRFVRTSGFARDTHQLCFMEFGSDVMSMHESGEKKDLIKVLQKYRHSKVRKSPVTRWTNWSVALAEAIRQKPDMFIFVTDGWSNWKDHRPCSFSAQYESLVQQCNQLKANGTRLLWVTSDLNAQDRQLTILGPLLNKDLTAELREEDLQPEDNLMPLDLITLKTFDAMRDLDFASLLHCDAPKAEMKPIPDILYVSLK